MRLTASAAALIFVLLAFRTLAVAAKPSCLQECGTGDCCSSQPCLAAPCASYCTCQADAKSRYETCIRTGAYCRPGPPGRCTVILKGCIEPCRAQYRAQLKKCRRADDAFGLPLDTCTPECFISSSSARKLAARTCLSCASVPQCASMTSATSTTAGATPPTTGASTTAIVAIDDDIDRCTQACVLRIPSLKSCYEDCTDACEGNKDAIQICQQSCRNFLCKAIRARCTGGKSRCGTPNSDPRYMTCCNPDNEPADDGECASDCSTPDEAPCEVTTTTTSTTRASTTTVVITTTTSTSPQLP